jgi:ribosomal protein S12 methylthiotransferase
LKIGFVSLGCPKNLVDTEVMMGQLVADGHELTPHPAEADVIVVNTCSFIDPAKQESVDTILEMAEYKKTGRAQRLVVAGCLVERFRNDIQRNIPEVDAVLGTNELEKITALCEGMAPKELAPEPYLYHDLTARVFTTPRHSAYIKIAEGCDHPCSFCIIPQFRGRFRSRRFESVINEATRMFAMGVREINLIGQDTTCYGEDFGLKDGLALLLEKLAGIDELRWVRFLYAYPNKITGKLLDTIASHDKICSYMDVPLQHASASVLKRLKRGAGADVFLKSIQKMRRVIPDLTLRTSFIVGFPGETEQEFEELCDFVREAQFDWMGAFSYSDQEGAGAYDLEKKLPSAEIERRRKHLMSIQRQISKKKKKALLGREFDLLLEGESEESDLLLEGRTQMHAPEIDGKVFINDFPDHLQPQPGQFYRCKITESHDYDLVAKVL